MEEKERHALLLKTKEGRDLIEAQNKLIEAYRGNGG